MIYLLTQEIQIAPGMMKADVWDFSKTNPVIFEVNQSPKSNIYAHDDEDIAPKKMNLKLFTEKIKLYEPIQIH